MRIWVDADACPGVIKEILFRAAQRVGAPLTLVANQRLRTPPSPLITSMVVPHGFDAADEEIIDQLAAGDLVITADIPLAAKVIGKRAHALDPRGTFYDEENIAERLSLRNFMDELRSTGMETGGPPAFSQTDRRTFANQLDRFLARRSTGQRSTP
jgi:uncharacterized protein YaiI (UPF0178 family)